MRPRPAQIRLMQQCATVAAIAYNWGRDESLGLLCWPERKQTKRGHRTEYRKWLPAGARIYLCGRPLRQRWGLYLRSIAARGKRSPIPTRPGVEVARTALDQLSKALRAYWSRDLDAEQPARRYVSQHASYAIPTAKLGIQGQRLRHPLMRTRSGRDWAYLDLAEPLRTDGKPVGDTVFRRRHGRWYVSIPLEIEVPDYPSVAAGGDIADAEMVLLGVDLNTRPGAMGADSEGKYHVGRRPRAELAAAIAAQARTESAIRDRGMGAPGSARRRTTQIHRDVISRREVDIRREVAHQIARSIVAQARSIGAAAIVLEALEIGARMIRDRRYAGALADAALAGLREAIETAAEAAGMPVIVIDPAWTSRRCHACGVIGDPGGSVYWRCEACGARHHRDQNAAINIRERGRSLLVRLLAELSPAPGGGVVTWPAIMAAARDKVRTSSRGDDSGEIPSRRRPADSAGSRQTDETPLAEYPVPH